MIDIIIAFALGIAVGVIAFAMCCTIAIKSKNKKD